MQGKAKYHICYGFWYIIENSKKWTQETDFLGFFQRFFGHALPLHMGDAQIVCQIKVLMKIHNRVKFHLHSIYSSQVINFQKFSWGWIIHELGHFGVFLTPNSPKYGVILLKLAQVVVFKDRNRVLKKVLENSTSQGNCTLGKFKFFSVFAQLWGPFTPWRRPKSKKLNIFLRIKFRHQLQNQRQNL